MGSIGINGCSYRYGYYYVRTKKFIAWLCEASNSDEAVEITKEYVDSIASAKGFFQTIPGRVTKNIAMSAMGAGVGLLVAGPAGVLGGAGAGKLLEPVADFGLDMLDEFILSGLTKGWTPEMFLEDIRKLEESNKSKQSDGEDAASV